jgi:hypothetical protein
VTQTPPSLFPEHKILGASTDVSPGERRIAPLCRTAPIVFPVLDEPCNFVGERQPLSDVVIRSALVSELQSHYADLDTHVVHEMPLFSGFVRVDVAVVNGELSGFEIKSDCDTLARLDRQVRAYRKVFDRLTVVTTDRHAKHVQARVPEWCGIAIANRNQQRIVFSRLQSASDNPEWDIVAVLNLLWQTELRKLGGRFGIRGTGVLGKDVIVRTLVGSAPDRDLRDAAIDALKRRLDAR